MKFHLFVALLLASALTSEAIFAGGLGLLALGALKLKALALLSGGRRRRRFRGRRRRFHKRSVLEAEELLLEASLEDSEDCAKKLVCALAARPQEELKDDEASLANMFGKKNELDVAQASVEFDLAALMGRRAGLRQCELIYARCQYQPQQLMDVIRQPGIVNAL